MSKKLLTSVVGVYCGLFPASAQDLPALQWVLAARLVPSRAAAAADGFGRATALAGQTAVVGAPGKNESAGAVYVFTRSDFRWVEDVVLAPADLAPGDRFGSSVAITAEYIAVGAPGRKGNAGSVFIFRLLNGTWVKETEFAGADTAAGDQFGRALAASDRSVLVGACCRTPSLLGGAYLFTRFLQHWSQEAKLVPPGDTRTFGTAVDLDGDTAAVGAPFVMRVHVFRHGTRGWALEASIGPEAPGAPFFNWGGALALSGNTVLIGDNSISTPNLSRGRVLAFSRTGSTWTQQDELRHQESSNAFGTSLAMRGRTAVVGSRSPCASPSNGGAWIYTRSAQKWTQQALLPVSVPAGAFGCSVAISAHYVLVGAPLANAAAIYVAIEAPRSEVRTDAKQ